MDYKYRTLTFLRIKQVDETKKLARNYRVTPAFTIVILIGVIRVTHAYLLLNGQLIITCFSLHFEVRKRVDRINPRCYYVLRSMDVNCITD